MDDSRSVAVRQRLGNLTAQLRQPYVCQKPPQACSDRPSCGAVAGPTIVATVPLSNVPEWATLERQLFEQMEQAIHPYLQKYTHPDGRLVYEPGLRGAPDLELDPDGGITSSRDGLDDFYGAYFCGPALLDNTRADFSVANLIHLLSCMSVRA